MSECFIYDSMSKVVRILDTKLRFWCKSYIGISHNYVHKAQVEYSTYIQRRAHMMHAYCDNMTREQAGSQVGEVATRWGVCVCGGRTNKGGKVGSLRGTKMARCLDGKV